MSVSPGSLRPPSANDQRAMQGWFNVNFAGQFKPGYCIIQFGPSAPITNPCPQGCKVQSLVMNQDLTYADCPNTLNSAMLLVERVIWFFGPPVPSGGFRLLRHGVTLPPSGFRRSVWFPARQKYLRVCSEPTYRSSSTSGLFEAIAIGGPLLVKGQAFWRLQLRLEE